MTVSMSARYPYTWAPETWKVEDPAYFWSRRATPRCWQDHAEKFMTPIDEDLPELLGNGTQEVSCMEHHKLDRYSRLKPYAPEQGEITLPTPMSLGRAIEWYRLQQIKTRSPWWERAPMLAKYVQGCEVPRHKVDSLELGFWASFADRKGRAKHWDSGYHEINCHKRVLSLIAKHRLTPLNMGWLGESLLAPVPSEYVLKRATKPQMPVVDFEGNASGSICDDSMAIARLEFFMNRMEVIAQSDQQMWFWNINHETPYLGSGMADHHSPSGMHHYWDYVDPNTGEVDEHKASIEHIVQHLTLAIYFMVLFGRNRYGDGGQPYDDGLAWSVDIGHGFLHTGTCDRATGHQRWRNVYRGNNRLSEEGDAAHRRGMEIARNFGVAEAVINRWNRLASVVKADHNDQKISDPDPLLSTNPWEVSHVAENFPYNYLHVEEDLNCTNGHREHPTHKSSRRFMHYSFCRTVAEEIVKKMQNSYILPRIHTMTINGI
jgi:hypothetical protein